MESEKAEMYGFFLINKTKKYETADLKNRLITTVQKMARSPIERLKALLAGLIPGWNASKIPPEVVVRELNTFLLLKATLDVKTVEGGVDRQRFEDRLKACYKKYWSKRQKIRLSEIRKDPEISDSLKILKEAAKVLYHDDPSGLQHIKSEIDTNLDKLKHQVDKTLTDMMRDTFVVLWDLPGTELDRIVIADQVFTRPIETGAAKEAMGEIADELILIVFAHNFLKIIGPALDRALKIILAGMKEIQAFHEAYDASQLSAISAKHKKLTEDMLQVMAGKIFGIRELLQGTLRQLHRCRNGVFEFLVEVEDLGNIELVKFITNLAPIDDIADQITNVINLQDQLGLFSKTVQALLLHATSRVVSGTTINPKEKELLGFVVVLYRALEYLRFYTDTYQDVQYFTVIKGGIGFEADKIIDLDVPEDSMIFGQDLFKTYKMKTSTIYAIRGVDIDIKRGEMVAIMGPSGSGKTTLLNILAGLDTADRGTIYVDGQNLSRLFKRDRSLTSFRRDKMGFIFQFYNLLPILSNQENVAYPRNLAGKSQGTEDALNILEQVGISENLPGKFPNQISGGQMQRVTVARSLINTPSILFADEPTGDLDSVTGEQVMKLLQQVNKDQGITTILVTHDPAIAKYATRIIHMEDGKIMRTDKIAV